MTGSSTATSVRPQVRELLTSSPAYRALPPEQRRQIAGNTVRVASYMVDPHGLIASEFRDPVLAGLVRRRTRGHAVAATPRAPVAIRMDPRAMDALLASVDFPTFVSNLIEGVFGAIVDASIQQMEAYAALIESVATSVDAFARDKISESSARDALASEFPDAVCRVGPRGRRLKMHAPAGSAGLAALQAALGLRQPVTDPAQAIEIERVVAAARRRMARNRQQILATTVLMGINRIVVTKGRIEPR